ncbi:hypothetical protein [Lactococcus allomyrinae]|uniref:Uncharacterized protein n=1 Tax=Lactococcus allomyrinae TaxID=2419773 RepID=A0A387BKZ3_9LACT|nr:hypothetical protein [Lactococcus allomyrinae]AYG01676.1 hypothetical protein D7I46_11800 [Lactococcus allomyrinae]
MLNNTFKTTSGLEQCVAVKFGADLIEVHVPQEVKYYDEKELQMVADSMLVVFKKNYNTILLSNTYDDNVTMPSLWIKSEDGTTLATYSVWSDSMKLK